MKPTCIFILADDSQPIPSKEMEPPQLNATLGGPDGSKYRVEELHYSIAEKIVVLVSLVKISTLGIRE